MLSVILIWSACGRIERVFTYAPTPSEQTHDKPDERGVFPLFTEGSMRQVLAVVADMNRGNLQVGSGGTEVVLNSSRGEA